MLEKSPPEVSILMCTNKFDDYYKVAISSCASQVGLDYEIVIVVNCVSKELFFEISNYLISDNITYVYEGSFKFLTFNLNLGLMHCKARYIARMDADDISVPNRISLQLSHMKENNVDVCGSNYSIIDSRGKILRKVNNPLSNNSIRRRMYYSNPLCHPSVMIDKRIIEKNGGYMGEKVVQDYDLWVRAARDSDLHFSNIGEQLVLYRSESDGEARKSSLAYSVMASIQLREFLLSGNPLWFFGLFVSILRRIFYSK